MNECVYGGGKKKKDKNVSIMRKETSDVSQNLHIHTASNQYRTISKTGILRSELTPNKGISGSVRVYDFLWPQLDNWEFIHYTI
jgi:hypothetical protein